MSSYEWTCCGVDDPVEWHKQGDVTYSDRVLISVYDYLHKMRFVDIGMKKSGTWVTCTDAEYNTQWSFVEAWAELPEPFSLAEYANMTEDPEA